MTKFWDARCWLALGVLALSLAACGASEGGATDPDATGLDAWGDAGDDAAAGGEAAWPDALAYDGPSLPHAAAVLGSSVEGRPLVVERFGDEGPLALVFATIHGNERPAQQVAELLRAGLLAHPERVAGLRLVLATLINPDGYAANTRANAHGIDLNRNFPASNFEPSDVYGPAPLSEPESTVVARLVEDLDPALIVSIHSPLDAINYDGPAEALAQAMSAASGLPIDQDIGIYPGSFGSWAGVDLAIPTITLELPKAMAALGDFDPWLSALHEALGYGAALAGQGLSARELIPEGSSGDVFEGLRLGDSAGGRPLLAERIGGAGAPVLVVAGLDGRAGGALVAQRLRARLLARAEGAGAPRVVLVSLANPDGAAAQRPLDQLGCDPGAGHAADGGLPAPGPAGTAPCAEGRALAGLLDTLAPRLLVVLEGRDTAHDLAQVGDAAAPTAAYADATWLAPTAAAAPVGGSLASWAAARGVPALVLGTPERPSRALVVRAEQEAEALEEMIARP